MGPSLPAIGVPTSPLTHSLLVTPAAEIVIPAKAGIQAPTSRVKMALEKPQRELQRWGLSPTMGGPAPSLRPPDSSFQRSKVNTPRTAMRGWNPEGGKGGVKLPYN